MGKCCLTIPSIKKRPAIDFFGFYKYFIMNHFNDHLLFSNNIRDNAQYLKALQEAQLNEVRVSKGIRSKNPEVKERAIAKQKAKQKAHDRLSVAHNKEYFRLAKINPEEAKKHAARADMHSYIGNFHIANIGRIGEPEQENINERDMTMDYLTKYYKNLSEQLQEQVIQLENVLLEYRKKAISHVDIHDVENTRDDSPMLHGRIVTKKGNPAGKGAAKEKNIAFYSGMGSMPNYPGDDVADAWETITNSGRPTVENNPIYANLMGKGSPQEVRTAEIFDNERRRRGHSEKGKGQKARKKKIAIDMAKAKADRERQG